MPDILDTLTDEEIISELSPGITDLANAITPRDLVRLVKELGGTEFTVPRSPTPEHPVSRAIGHDQAGRLGAYAGGGRVYIPLASDLRRNVRNKRIRELRQSGRGANEIARMFGVACRQIQRICASHR